MLSRLHMVPERNERTDRWRDRFAITLQTTDRRTALTIRQTKLSKVRLNIDSTVTLEHW